MKKNSCAPILLGLWLVAGLAGSNPAADDEPVMFASGPSRNMISDEKDLPAEWDLKSGKNIKWVAELGSQTYAGPIYHDGKIYVGTNNEKGYDPRLQGDRGNVMAFDAETGELL